MEHEKQVCGKTGDARLRGVDLIDQAPLNGTLPVLRIIYIQRISKINLPPGTTAVDGCWDISWRSQGARCIRRSRRCGGGFVNARIGSGSAAEAADRPSRAAARPGSTPEERDAAQDHDPADHLLWPDRLTEEDRGEDDGERGHQRLEGRHACRTEQLQSMEDDYVRDARRQRPGVDDREDEWQAKPAEIGGD